jgi:Phagosome assembly factor 1
MIRVDPGAALGPFSLGRPVGDAISYSAAQHRAIQRAQQQKLDLQRREIRGFSPSQGEKPAENGEVELRFDPADPTVGGAVVVPLAALLERHSLQQQRARRRPGENAEPGKEDEDLVFVLRFAGASAQALVSLELAVPPCRRVAPGQQGSSPPPVFGRKREEPMLDYHGAKIRFPLSLAACLSAFGPASLGTLSGPSAGVIATDSTNPFLEPPSSTTTTSAAAAASGTDLSEGGSWTYAVEYPGLVLEFALPARYAAAFETAVAAGGAAEGAAAIPASDIRRELALGRLPDGTSPVATRLRVFAGARFADGAMPLLVSPANPKLGELVRAERVRGSAGDDAPFELLFVQRSARLRIGDAVQDVLSLLGPPEGVTSKEHNVMMIHEPGSAAVAGADVIYNYFSLGIDVCFSHAHGLAANKVVLHANAPGHPEFGVYAQCNFVLVAGPASAPNGGVIVATSTLVDVRGSELVEGEPLVHNQPGSASLLLGAEDAGVVFEVVEDGGALAKVTIF